MTDDNISSEDFENFEDKSKEEKMETLQKLHRKLADGDDTSGLLQEVGLEGELTVRVLDDGGEEKQVEKKEFKTGY